MRALVSVAALLALAGCAAPPQKPLRFTDPVISFAGDVVTYRGYFSFRNLATIEALVGSRPVKTLRIRSHGGSVNAAIDVARWVHRNGIDVIVDGGCLSSCANYVFPAGKEKHIVVGGVVGWHGTVEHRVYLHTHGRPIDDKLGISQWEALAVRERAFFSEIGINGYIGWFGRLEPYKQFGFYYLSAADMEYFGMKNLHVRGDYLTMDVSHINLSDKNALGLLTVDRAITNARDPNWMPPVRAQQ